MLTDLLGPLTAAIVSLATWSAPQPPHSAGLLVVYGNQALVQANSDFRGYDLSLVPGECGFSAISPAMLGKLAWFSTSPTGPWVGPCVSVDAVARQHMYESVYVRHEVAEVSRDTAAQLGFTHGALGFVYFSPCYPPNHRPSQTAFADPGWLPPQPYAPPLEFSALGHNSFWPYPPQETPGDCAIVPSEYSD